MGEEARSFGTPLVTGASSGIGASAAQALASDGTDLVLAARGGGTIVNVARLGGASKFALCGWTEVMALDLSHTLVDVRLFGPVR